MIRETTPHRDRRPLRSASPRPPAHRPSDRVATHVVKRSQSIPRAHSARQLSQKTNRQLARSAHKALLLQKSATRQQPVVKQQQVMKLPQVPKFDLRRTAALVAIAILVIMTGYLTLDVWRVNSRLKQELASTAAALGSPDPSAHQQNEGKDRSKVTKSAVDSYTVEASLPRVLSIDKLGIRARVMPMGVNPDNSMQAPINIYDTGWYMSSAKPGEPGATVIDGHSGLADDGVFAHLEQLTVGDTLKLEKGDHDVLTYQVVKIETVTPKTLDMNKLLRPYDNAPQALNLITCTGTYQPSKETYDHRIVIYTKRIE